MIREAVLDDQPDLDRLAIAQMQRTPWPVDVVVLANRRAPVAQIAHTAIWLPRQLAAA